MKLIKEFLGFSLGPILGALIGFLTVPITTYFISPSEYGKTSIFTMVEMILLYVIYLGMDQGFIREYHEQRDKKKLILNCSFIPIVISAVLIITSPIYARRLSLWMFNEEYPLIVYMLVCTLPLIIFEKFILLSIRMEEKAVQYSLYSILVKIISFFFTLFFIFFIRKDFLAIVYSTLLGQIVSDLLLLFKFHEYLNFQLKKLNLIFMKRLIKYCVPLGIVVLVTYLLNSMDKLFLKYYSDYYELGLYSVSMKITSLIIVVQSAFSSFWTPVANRWYYENRNNKDFETVIKFTCCVLSICFILILLFERLLLLFVSSQYEESLMILPFLLFYPVMATLGTTTELGMQFTRKTKFAFYSSLIALVINIILNFIFVPMLGAKGAAFSTGISYIYLFLSKSFFSRILWFDFSVYPLFITISLLFVCAFLGTWSNLYILNQMVYLISLLSILIIFRKEIYLIYIILKKGRANKRI